MIQIDMKMPKTCRECQFEIDHRRCFITGESIVMRGPFGRPDSCPLHPLDDEILDDDKIHVGDEVCFNDGESFKAVVLDAVAMRPIDADKLKEAVKYSESMYIGYLNHHAEAGHDPIDKDLVEASIKWHEGMRKLIDASPTIEAQPELTGHWVEFPNHNAYVCSECGRMIETADGKNNVYRHYPYCHCGAMMKEGE